MKIGNFFELTNDDMFLMAGPCVLESNEINEQIASTLKALKVSDANLVQEPFKRAKIYEQVDGGGKIQNNAVFRSIGDRGLLSELRTGKMNICHNKTPEVYPDRA